MALHVLQGAMAVTGCSCFMKMALLPVCFNLAFWHCACCRSAPPALSGKVTELQCPKSISNNPHPPLAIT